MTVRKRTNVDWEDIRFFVALARHGTLSSAGRALSVNHATIARRISSLEKSIGEKLVERRPDGYVLTPAGSRVLGPSNDMLAAAEAFSRGGSDEQLNGVVRINAPPSLTHGFLVSRLAKFSTQYAGLDIDLASDFRNVSLERREADISLRLGRPEDGDVIAKRLATITFGFYASPKWCHRIEQGDASEFVGFDEVSSYIPEAVWLSRHFPRARVCFRTNSHLGQAEAARQGAGIALLPYFIGKYDQCLRPCTLRHSPPARELWLIMRPTDLKDAPIRTVVDHLVEIFRAERALFSADADCASSSLSPEPP
jgi:DNA-binding transcriptional LysR family regulator